MVILVGGTEGATVQQIGQIPMHTPSGDTVPLASAVRLTATTAPQQIRHIEEMDAIIRLLGEHMPEQIGVSVVHGDYRLGNFKLRDARIAAVLDWELCTLGDPLADVGYLLNNWVAPGEIPDGVPNTNPTASGGFPERGELLERYGAATGRDLTLIPYYRAFSYFRSAAINEGVYARYLGGAYGDPAGQDLTRFAESTPRLAKTALELLETEI